MVHYRLCVWVRSNNRGELNEPFPKIQPEKPGKIIWLTGAPGMGKSTSAQILGREHGHVYYEADCFGGLKNPVWWKYLIDSCNTSCSVRPPQC